MQIFSTVCQLTHTTGTLVVGEASTTATCAFVSCADDAVEFFPPDSGHQGFHFPDGTFDCFTWVTKAYVVDFSVIFGHKGNERFQTLTNFKPGKVYFETKKILPIAGPEWLTSIIAATNKELSYGRDDTVGEGWTGCTR